MEGVLTGPMLDRHSGMDVIWQRCCSISSLPGPWGLHKKKVMPHIIKVKGVVKEGKNKNPTLVDALKSNWGVFYPPVTRGLFHNPRRALTR